MIQLEYGYTFFVTSEVAGVATAADSTPTAILYRNGTASGVTVTVASTAVTGLYKITFTTLGTGDGWALTDVLHLTATATIAATSGYVSIVWDSTGDVDAVMRGTDGANTTTPPTTGEILTALGTGTWLTAIPWNVAWDAEVQSECTDALVALDLDTALIAQGSERAVNVDNSHRVHSHVYDIQTQPVADIQDGLATSTALSAVAANVTTILNRVTTTVAQLWADLIAMITGSGVDPQFTETALENAPVGGESGALDEILAALSGGAVPAYSPVNAAGDVTIIKGDDYLGTRLAVRIDDVGGTLLAYLQGASVTSVSLGAGIDSQVNQVVGTIDPDDGVYADNITTLYPQITSADITGPSSDNYVYHVKAVDSVLGEQTQATGNMIVLTERRQL